MDHYKPRHDIHHYLLYGLAVAVLAAISGNYGKRKDELSGVDIVAEYELIQQKKSRLSRRLRDRVCYIYENRES